MPIPQKVFSHLILAVFAFGSLACPCPVEASSEAGSHPHHQAQQEASSTATGCPQHSDCSRISADTPPEVAALPFKTKFQLDDSGSIEPETSSLPNRSRPVTWTAPPPRRLWLSHDTPVRRFDRLID